MKIFNKILLYFLFKKVLKNNEKFKENKPNKNINKKNLDVIFPLILKK